MNERNRRLLASAFALLPITETFVILAVIAAHSERLPKSPTLDGSHITLAMPGNFDYAQASSMMLF